MRLIIVLVGLVGVAVAIVLLKDRLSLAELAARETQLRAWRDQSPAVTYSLAFALYVFVTSLALPFATVLSIVYGWLFGFWPSLVLVSFASTTGATCSFLLSRHLIGDLVRGRYASWLALFDAALEREGAFYLFSLRLVPYVPFFVINLVMGLTRMRVRTFWWVSQLGMLPASIAYLAAASSIGSLDELQRNGLSSLFTPRLALSLTALALLPWAIRGLLAMVKRLRTQSP